MNPFSIPMRLLLTGLIVCILTGCSDTSPPVGDNMPAPGSAAPTPQADFSTKAWHRNFEQSESLLKGDRWKDAIDLLNSSMEAARADVGNTVMFGRYLSRLGQAYYFNNQDDSAILTFEDALKLYYGAPTNEKPPANFFFAVHSYLGKSYLNKKNYPKAEKNLAKAVEYSKKVAPSQMNNDWLKKVYQALETTYIQEKKVSKAVEVRTEAKKLFGGK
jgi:tetratricopeptide (TPR) repeat protein